jgi:imidazolonepropionase-like amidohydrolase
MRIAAAVVASVLLLVAPPSARARSLLIQNARLIDGTGAPPRAPVAILIRDGRIVDIAPHLAAADVPVLDADGSTVLPGLIDAHVHLQEVIGAEVRHDSPEETRRLRRAQLRSYLASGVTTVLDTAIRPAVAAEIRQWLADGDPGPTFLTLGPPVAPRDGYMSPGYPDLVVSEVADLDRVFDAIARAGAVGVKVPIERGFGPLQIWQVHPPEVRAAIARKAAERRLPIYVHASDEVEQTIGLDMGAHALVHTNFAGTPPTAAFVERAVHSRAYMITTFSCIDATLVRWHPERLDDPVIVTVVPEVERRTAQDPAAWVESAANDLAYAFPRLPRFALRLLDRVLANEDGDQNAVHVNLRAARQLHEAGVPLVIGSDAGNSVLAQFHGPSTLREMELLAEAGLSPADVIAAATRVPARMLGRADEIGTVEPGKRGDLLIVRDDPLRDIRALRTNRWTVKDGVARTPVDWMQR